MIACSSEPGIPTPGSSVDPFTLSLVGDEELTLHPDEERTLHILLAKEEEGPVASARVHFEIRDGDPAGSRLDAADAVTDEDGIARVRLTAGSRPGPTFHLLAIAPEHGKAQAAFSVSVIPERRVLEIVPTFATRVSADGASATTTVGTYGSVALRVRELDADTGDPVARDRITFTLPDAATSRWSTTSGRATTVQTGLGGEARAFLVAATAPEGPWDVIAQTSSGASVTFSVRVQGGAAACAANAQCPPGQICYGDPPECQDDELPPGADCDPAAPACGGGQCCDPAAFMCRDPCAMTCAAGTHCDPGSSCGSGACVPDDQVPDLSGLWLTRHHFDLRETLPIGVRDVFRAVRLLDQTLLGKLTIPGLPFWLQDIVNTLVSRLLVHYLPPWTQLAVHLSDDLFTVLSDLRAEGAMRLKRDGDAAHLTGKEVWSSLVFYWLPLCDGDISGDPDVPPECARIDVLTTDSERADETLQCKGQLLPPMRVLASPFTARVVRQGAAWALSVDRRQVNVQMSKVLLILVDQMLTLVTGGEYHCIDEATLCPPGGGCMADCDGLGLDVESATDGVLDSGTVQHLCAEAVQAVGHTVVEALATAWPLTADTLDFSGGAMIKGQADDSSCDRGAASGACAASLTAGTWKGDLFFRLLRSQPGTWEAMRPE